MSKAEFIANLLMKGKTINKYKEGGNSMLPLIKSNQPVKLEPVDKNTLLLLDDIVFCKVKGNYYTHKISATRNKFGSVEYQISNNHGNINGWIKRKNIFGIVTKIYEK